MLLGIEQTRLPNDVVKAERHNSGGRRRTGPQESGNAHSSVSRYKNGEYVRVEIASGADEEMLIWMRVDHCDETHSIVFGVIDDDDSRGVGKTLRSGEKLAASYSRVRECRAVSDRAVRMA